jgi:structure-specific recognition protein 1
LYIPPPPDFENNDKETPSNAELLQQRIVKTASIKKTSGNVICEFPETKGTFLTPRGRYTIELYETFLRMRGNKYDYKIRYDDISRLFLLPKPDEVHMAFVIALDKPIRQGQQRYQYLVLQTNKEHAEVTINLSEEALEKEYKGDLQPVMSGQFSNLVAKTFKIIAKKKVFIPGKFANANQQACVKCALRANDGLLYPLEKQFLFIHKPPVLIRFDEVESVEFQRYAGGQGSTRNFDLCVTLQASAAAAGTKEYTFSGIDRTDYTGLYNFLSGKKIVIKNLEGVGLEEARPTAPVYDENIIYGVGGEDDEEESEDEDFDVNENNAEGEDSESEDIDDDDLGSEIDDDLDSDIEEARKKTGKPGKSKKSQKSAKKRKAEGSDDDDDDDEEDKPKKKKNKAAASSPKSTPKKKKKKDAKAPKKPSSAYNFFTSVNRAKLKEDNPEASFGDLVSLMFTFVFGVVSLLMKYPHANLCLSPLTKPTTVENGCRGLQEDVRGGKEKLRRHGYRGQRTVRY